MADLMQQAREQFEAWATSQQLPIKRHRWGEYKVDDTETAWEAWQAALRAAPEGFVLVPVEPTVKMIQSACIASNAGNMYLHNDVRMLGVWSAMLAARPQGVK